MKKFILYSLLYLFGMMVQFGWAKYCAPYGISPDFMLVCLVLASLLRGPVEGELLGFAWGISWDAMSIEMFGSHAFIFTCIGYLVGLLSKKWDESKVSAQMLLVGIVSVSYIIGMKIIYAIFGANQYSYNLNYIILIQPIYNMLIAPAVYWVGKRLSALLD